MRKAILSIVFVSTLTLILSGCSNDADKDFENKKECSSYLAGFKNSIELPETTIYKTATVDNFEVFYSKKMNTCIGTYVFTSRYANLFPADQQQLIIKDLLTGKNIYAQSFFLRLPGATTTNMDENTTKIEFLKKINELKQ